MYVKLLHYQCTLEDEKWKGYLLVAISQRKLQIAWLLLRDRACILKSSRIWIFFYVGFLEDLESRILIKSILFGQNSPCHELSRGLSDIFSRKKSTPMLCLRNFFNNLASWSVPVQLELRSHLWSFLNEMFTVFVILSSLHVFYAFVPKSLMLLWLHLSIKYFFFVHPLHVPENSLFRALTPLLIPEQHHLYGLTMKQCAFCWGQ